MADSQQLVHNGKPVDCSGILMKLGGGAFEKLQDRFFILSGTELTYYDCKSLAEASASNQKGTINVSMAQVIDRGTYKKALCFSIEGENLAKGTKEYFLFSNNRDEKWRWLSCIMAATGRYTFMSAGQGPLNEQRLKTSPLYPLIQGEVSNQSCADCGAPWPTWCVLREPFGAFICIECIGLHRKLWAPSCKETQLDKWSDAELEIMKGAGGNAAVNQQLEFHVPEGVFKPSAFSNAVLREKYIQLKWGERAFVKGASGAEEPRPPVPDNAPAPKNNGGVVLGQPPKYIGIVFAMLLRTNKFVVDGGVAILTNGFQEIRSMPGKKDAEGTNFTQMMQLGIDTLDRPMYVTFFDKGEKIVGTTELLLSKAPSGSLSDFLLTTEITGKGVAAGATAQFSVTFTQLT